ncbi:Dihydrofolate reductase [Actinopolyspora mzabensis]|uniref:Dihydrofolate reductase n=1 Tax=Actinopolyspora mzabensis TaxID=995066 RepID=A0A1G9EH56_ACTMZ|nr:dihydrofolate reductase family protein [Actinopolyspora mzabensis]SDK75434.1 Dihydrofolate reductase [Actinopolyspora mzabensis]
MRRIVSSLFVSLDGVVESPDQWQHDFDEEMGASLATTLETTDTVLLGRVTWTEWAGYWPSYDEGDEDSEFARWINGSPKYVASTTLDSVAEWPNSFLLEADLASAVKELKAAPGKGITVAGSPGLVVSLLDRGLLDELQLLIHPVIAGGGRRKLFADNSPLQNLELVDSSSTSSGTIIATYRPK